MTFYYERVLAAGEAAGAELPPVPAAEIWKRVAELEPCVAAVILRHFADGESYFVIGRALGVSKSTVCNLVQEGLQQLRAMLAEAGESDGPTDRAGSHRKYFQPTTLAIQKKGVTKTSIAANRAANARKQMGHSCPA